MQKSCQACGSASLNKKGFGTEQIQERNFITTSRCKGFSNGFRYHKRKTWHEKIITAFENNEIDVLVGTQMLTKGLDFRNVGLVGIMNADNLLNFPDFRAHERSFQLMHQVAGRAGRTI